MLENYATNIMQTRLERLNDREIAEVLSLTERLTDPSNNDKNALMARFGKIMVKADSYDLLPHDDEIIAYQYDINRSVWKEAEILRKTGALIELGRKIQCRVVAIHGDYDPHPPEGVEVPLAAVLEDFRFILINNCGHYPWQERHAKEEFFALLRDQHSR